MSQEPVSTPESCQLNSAEVDTTHIDNLSLEVLAQIIIMGFQYDDLTPSLVEKNWYRVVKSLAYRRIMTELGFPSLRYPYKINYCQHKVVASMIEKEQPTNLQQEDDRINRSSKNIQNLLLGEPGIGKTVIMLYHYIKTRTPQLASLIIVPASIIMQWKNEIEKYIGDQVRLIFFYGKEKPHFRDELIERFQMTGDLMNRVRSDGDLIISTPQTLRAERYRAYSGLKFWNYRLWVYEYIYVDEECYRRDCYYLDDAQLYDPETLNYIKAKWILTAIPKHDISVYSCVIDVKDYQINPITDHFKTKIFKYVDDSNHQEKRILEEFLVDVNNFTYKSAMSVINYNKIMHHYSEELISEIDSKTGKIGRLMWLINQMFFSQERGIVFCPPTVIKKLAESLKMSGVFVTVVDMKCPPMSRTDRIEKFSNSPPPSLLLTTYRISAIGLNMQSANNVIYLYPPINSSYYTQSFGRVCRIGQKTSLLKIHYLYSSEDEKRLDDLIHENLAKMVTSTRRRHNLDDIFLQSFW